MLHGVRRLDETRRHARDLTPAVRDLLAEQGSQVRASGCDRRPGTGKLYGTAGGHHVGKDAGLCHRLSDPGHRYLCCHCPPAPAKARTVDVSADAQQDRVYVQQYGRNAAGTPRAHGSALRIQPFPEWIAQASQEARHDLGERGSWVSGPGLRGNEGRIPKTMSIVPASLCDPLPESLLHLGLRRIQQGERDDLWSVEPLYLQPSAAEQQWQARGR